MPNVSVIVPNYNHAPFLPQRLDSVLGQSFRDFDVIILDDASTDGSREIIARYGDDPRVRVHLNRENSGSAFRQWNLGVSMTEGRHVWIAESDDFSDCGFLETMVARLDAHPDVGIAYCRSERIDEAGSPLAGGWDWTAELDADHWASDFVSEGREECGRYLVFRNTIPNASSVVFRRDIYRRAGCADTGMNFCGDWMAWARMLMISDLAFVAKPLNCHRSHGGTVRASKGASASGLAERLEVQTYIVEELGLGSTVRRRLCKALRDSWYGVWALDRRERAWRKNRPVYALARRIDSTEARRTLVAMLCRLVWASGPLLPVRAVVRVARGGARRLCVRRSGIAEKR